MLEVIFRRLVAVVPTLLIVGLIAVLLLEVGPVSPATVIAGDNATPQQIRAVSERLGLNRPLIDQYFSYLWHALHGNLGTSFAYGQSVASEIGKALTVTLAVSAASLVMVAILGLLFGIVAASTENKWPDKIITAFSAVAAAIPVFVVALVLVVVFAVDKRWFPATGYSPLSAGFFNWLRSITLPALALALAPGAELARQTRAQLLICMRQDYVRTAWANGAGPAVVLLRHSMKNAAPVLLTVFGLQIVRVFGGTVIVENVFAIPGFGNLAYLAVVGNDFPMIQGIVLVSAVIILSMNLIVDLLTSYLDPVLRRR